MIIETTTSINTINTPTTTTEIIITFISDLGSVSIVEISKCKTVTTKSFLITTNIKEAFVYLNI